MSDQRHATATTMKMCTAIITHMLITLALLLRAMHSSMASGVLSTLSSSAFVISATMANQDTGYELHATHISIDSLKMTVDNGHDLSQLTFEPKFLNFDELSVGESEQTTIYYHSIIIQTYWITRNTQTTKFPFIISDYKQTFVFPPFSLALTITTTTTDEHYRRNYKQSSHHI